MKNTMMKTRSILLRRWWFWLPLIMLLIWGIYRFLKQAFAKSDNENPMDILRRRYANGDISTEEFERRRNLLSPGLLLEK